MRLQEIDDSDETAIVEYIKLHCKQWLAATNNGEAIVYRGVKLPSKELIDTEISPNAFIRPVRADRRPKDSSDAAQNNFNAIIQAMGGVANRSNSAFVSSRFSFAKNYGKVFVYLPIGEFHYTWSPCWADWFISYGSHTFIDLLDYNALPHDKLFDVATAAIDFEIKHLTRFAIDSDGQDEWMRITNSLRLASLTGPGCRETAILKYYCSKSEERSLDILRANPNSYDKKKLEPIIKIDTDLLTAISNGRGPEILISSKMGLYIDYEKYSEILRLL